MEKINIIDEKGKDLLVRVYDHIPGVEIFIGDWDGYAIITLNADEVEEFIQVLRAKQYSGSK